jgi:hypothetical protein
VSSTSVDVADGLRVLGRGLTLCPACWQQQVTHGVASKCAAQFRGMPIAVWISTSIDACEVVVSCIA